MHEWLRLRYQILLTMLIVLGMWYFYSRFDLSIEYAKIAEQTDNPAFALLNYEQALRYDADNPDLYFAYAQANREAGEFDAALAAYRLALEQGYHQPRQVYLEMGWILYEIEQFDEAAAAFERALQVPGEAQRQELASAYGGLGWVAYTTQGCDAAQIYFFAEAVQGIGSEKLREGRQLCR
jgi:tetratricopeptide (TPR) repeat protein